MLEPCLESLSVLWSVTVNPSETFRFPIDLVFRKCRIVDPDLKASLGGRLSDVFIVRPLQGREIGVKVSELRLERARACGERAYPVQLGEINDVILSRASSSTRTGTTSRWPVAAGIRRAVVHKLAVRLSLVIVGSHRLDGAANVWLDICLS